jgi:tetratricopeptide (TPR) repeat protein
VGDGRRLAKLKLVAGLTGLPLDALVQRENARRQRRLAALATVAGALAIAMAVLALVAVRGQAEAQRQRSEAEGLVEFMLTDLRARLEPVGRLEIFDSVGQRALAYYGTQDLDALDADGLGRRARALHLVGEVRDLRGDGAGALDAFALAERSTAELLERHPGDPQRLFDHAQSVFWVGYIAWQRKALADAERHFAEYHRLATALVAIDPANEDWQDELANALSNLGVLFQDSQRYDEAADRFAQSLTIAQASLRADPADRGRQWSLAQAHAWLADAVQGQGDLAAARQQRQLELAVLETMLAADDRDADARQGKAVALSQLANLDLLAGDVAAADHAAQTALALARQLLAEDPDNRFRRELVVLIGNRATEALLLDERLAQAALLNGDILERAAALAADDATVAVRRSEGLMTARWLDIALRFALDGRGAGREAIERFGVDFGSGAQVAADAPRSPWVMVLAMDALDRAAAGDRDGAGRQVAALRALVPYPPQPRERAVLGFLGAALDIDTLPGDAPAPAGATGYAPGAFLQAAQGTRP